jgi:hypothetical protein
VSEHERPRPPTVGEQLDFEAEMNRQAFESIESQLTGLAKRVAFLERLISGVDPGPRPEPTEPWAKALRQLAEDNGWI